MARPLLRDRDVRDLALAPLEEVQAALALLTRVPVGGAFITRSGAAAFGLVGALVGAAGGVPVMLIGEGLPWVAAVLAVATLALVSGALHLDGLSDTADALVAVGPVAAERARRDPRAGPAGVVALIAVLALQVVCLTALVGSIGPAGAAAALIGATSLGRTLAVVVGRAHRLPGFGAGGAGRRFADGITALGVAATVVTSIVVVTVAAVATSMSVALAGAIGALLGAVVGSLLVRWRHGLDGDGLGALIELGVTGVLLVGAVVTVVPA